MSSVRVFLLGSLAERGPMHGHQLRLLAEREHVHLWTDFTGGSLYGALNRLLAEGLVEEERTEREGARPERRVVRITATGLEALEGLRREALAAFSVRPDPFDVVMARLGTEVLDELPAVLRARRAVLLTEVERREEVVARVGPVLTRAERHVVQHGVVRARAELQWLDDVLADLPQIIADEKTREAD